MEKIEATTASAKTTDFRREVDGKPNAEFNKEITVKYEVPAFDVVSTEAEMDAEFSKKQLLSMAQSRQKATANSAARQKALAPYAPKENDLARINMIKAALQLNPKLTEEQAAAYVDSLATVGA